MIRPWSSTQEAGCFAVFSNVWGPGKVGLENGCLKWGVGEEGKILSHDILSGFTVMGKIPLQLSLVMRLLCESKVAPFSNAMRHNVRVLHS